MQSGTSVRQSSRVERVSCDGTERYVAPRRVCVPEGCVPDGCAPKGVSPKGWSPKGAYPRRAGPRRVLIPEGLVPEGCLSPKGWSPKGAYPRRAGPRRVLIPEETARALIRHQKGRQHEGSDRPPVGTDVGVHRNKPCLSCPSSTKRMSQKL